MGHNSSVSNTCIHGVPVPYAFHVMCQISVLTILCTAWSMMNKLFIYLFIYVSAFVLDVEGNEARGSCREVFWV
jgi:hypothetical protein